MQKSKMFTVALLGFIAVYGLFQELKYACNDSFFNASSSDRTASYLYAPGFSGTEFVMGRYCPHFVASTGEGISWGVGGHVIGQPHSAVRFPEIDFKKPTTSTWNPIKRMINNMRNDLYPLVYRFKFGKYGIKIIDNPDSPETVTNYSFNFGRANLAQKNDIKALRKAYEQHIEQYPDTDVVLYGDSRGATTIFNFIATDNPTHVKAAISEGIFDAMPHVMKHCLYNDKEARTEKRLSDLLSFVVRDYKKTELTPRDYAEMINDDIPLLLVTSLNDWIVPPQCTMYLYNRLRERGHKKVHLLVLNNASHPGYMLDNAPDRERYEATVHAFYQRYGLPHNRLKASMGQHYFAFTQPSLAELNELYAMPTCDDCSARLV